MTEIMDKELNKLLVLGFYFGIALAAYFLNFGLLLFVLALPWSYGTLLFSNLIIHLSVKGMDRIMLLDLIGAGINVAFFFMANASPSPHMKPD